jgi:beta-lactamase regulating signal transducer with metallopeptidase domain
MEMGRMLMEYCLNAVWLVPVVAGAAWLLVKVSGLRPAGEHRVWLGALVVCLVLPAMGTERPRAQVVTPAPEVRPQQVSAEFASAGSQVPVRTDPAVATAEPFAPSAPAEAAPAQRDWFMWRPREIPMAPRVVAWFGWVYAGVMGFAAFRIAHAWWAALRLVREASPYAMDDAEDAMLRELAASFCVRVPQIFSSERVQSPVVVGLRRTVLLLPAGFERCSHAERRAALCHELAHVQRRDCLLHAGVQALMLPLVWHPAVHLVGRRISRTREMVCDEMAAAAMHSGTGELTYARCLLNLARTMLREEGESLAGAGLGLFRTNKLEERVMKLTEVKRVLTVREMLVRRAGGVAVAGLVLVAGAMVHVAPVVAQESAPPPPAVPLTLQAPLAPAAAPAVTGVAVPDAALDPKRSHPGSAPIPAPAPAAEAFAPGSSFADRSSFGAGASGSGTAFENFPGGLFQDEHGQHVTVKDGDHVHRWVGADGQRYEVRDGQAAPYTRAQERAAEAEYERKLAEADAAIARVTRKLNSPEFKAQIDKISSKASMEAMATAEAELARASAQFDSPEFKAQMAHLNSPEFKAQLDAQMKSLNAQMAQFDSKALRDATGPLISAEVEANLARAERQAALADSPEMQQKLADAAKRLDEASARLEAATKALAEAQKRLQATPSK